MIELKLSPFNPGKAISSNQQFYYLYKDGKIVDRTLYSKFGYLGKEYKGLLILNRREIAEIPPKIFNACRERYKHYPKYCMSDDIVIVNGETGKVIFDTKAHNCISETPNIISDYMFIYKNTLYNNQGNIIREFNNIILLENDNVIIIKDGNKYSKHSDIYIYDVKGNLLNCY